MKPTRLEEDAYAATTRGKASLKYAQDAEDGGKGEGWKPRLTRGACGLNSGRRKYNL